MFGRNEVNWPNLTFFVGRTWHAVSLTYISDDAKPNCVYRPLVRNYTLLPLEQSLRAPEKHFVSDIADPVSSNVVHDLITFDRSLHSLMFAYWTLREPSPIYGPCASYDHVGWEFTLMQAVCHITYCLAWREHNYIAMPPPMVCQYSTSPKYLCVFSSLSLDAGPGLMRFGGRAYL